MKLTAMTIVVGLYLGAGFAAEKVVTERFARR